MHAVNFDTRVYYYALTPNALALDQGRPLPSLFLLTVAIR